MKLRFKKAKRLCGLDATFEIKNEATFNAAMDAWKEKVVAARNANDDALAADLSQCKELFKNRYQSRVSRLCTCGSYKSGHSSHCNVCARRMRFYPNQLTKTSPMKEHEIEPTLTVIGPRCHQTGILTATLRKMADTSQVGDSFITDKHTTSVKNVARMLGLEVIVRIANPEEKDLKKRRNRVWRSDGLEMNGVNEIIRKRMTNEAVPPPKKCVPLPPEEVARRKQSKQKRGRPVKLPGASASD